MLQITADAADQSHVRVGVHEDLDVEVVAQHGLGEHQDALDDDHGQRTHQPALGPARMRDVIVDRHLDRKASAKLGQMLGQKRAVQRAGVVVVDRRPLLHAQLTAIPIVGVVLDDHTAIQGHGRGQLLGNRGLARPGASGNADDQGRETAFFGHAPAYITVVAPPVSPA
jgi:hypothetical protein